MKNLIITIDGPAGAGKTDTAGMVGKKLNLIHYNSGYTYRAITFALIKNNLINYEYDSDKVRSFIRQINIKNIGNEVLLDCEKITDQLKSKEVDAFVPKVSKVAYIREKAKEILLEFATSGVGLVVEGRDIGTVVLPNADVKIFLTASLEIRALRRFDQTANSSYEDVFKGIKERDNIDTTREIAPMKIPENGFIVDNSYLTKSETAEQIVGITRGLMNIKSLDEE
ncbi:cytidylate kinase [Anncaliia algerae PRA339]|uniref:(d)CMP kinase n=1 Tax=Anncaliia algerae PRA339 TaxID=1288291 RepID=A0A059EXP5_9MICR|nr:cytidylate kinase [Anncaliia algerae PRA339]